MTVPKEPIDRLDEKLPEGIDRRKFLGATVAGLLGVSAGCIGDDDDDDDTDNDFDLDTPFRQPWVPEPTWAVGWIADDEGHWEDAGLSQIHTQEGEGSDDTAAGVIGGQFNVACHDMAAGVGAWDGADAGDVYIFGINKQWGLFGLMWPEQYGDSLDDLDDLTDTDEYYWVCSSGNALNTWEIIRNEYDLDQSQDETTLYSEAETRTAIEDGEADVVYGSVDTVGVNNEAVAANDDRYADSDEMVARGVSSNIHDVIGFPFVVNGDFYDDNSDVIDEFLARVLEGYSSAAHWAFTNPDDAIDFIKGVNPDLEDVSEDALTIQMQTVVATELGSEGFENGVGWLDEDAIRESVDILEPIMAPDEGVPDADDLIISEPYEMADLTTFDEDEEQAAREYAADVFEAFGE